MYTTPPSSYDRNSSFSSSFSHTTASRGFLYWAILKYLDETRHWGKIFRSGFIETRGNLDKSRTDFQWWGCMHLEHLQVAGYNIHIACDNLLKKLTDCAMPSVRSGESPLTSYQYRIPPPIPGWWFIHFMLNLLATRHLLGYCKWEVGWNGVSYIFLVLTTVQPMHFNPIIEVLWDVHISPSLQLCWWIVVTQWLTCDSSRYHCSMSLFDTI